MQGGHVAGKYALTTNAPISGCVMLSTWLEPIPAPVCLSCMSLQYDYPNLRRILMLRAYSESLLHNLLQAPELNQSIPFFIGHGTADPLIPVTMADATRNQLQQKGTQQLQMY